ncbi:plasmid partitioning protein [Frankia sp. Mgl5]|uniref:alpha/beta hydrolase family esterase n=1 Tax=Frankia sp. Mgl5 TaxID=2933793 RepID=UPI0020108118|nr:PHB depolymerase family esterase [Frankia sp. Mgl5]MCK9927112.1 plasmid partitioning protein [Frankia sp. Mgl5]
MATGNSAGRRRSHGRAGAGSARSGVARQGLARSSALRHGSRPANTLWLPLTAAAGVLLLLVWYAMSQDPGEATGSSSPVASALGGAGGASSGPAAVAAPTVPPPPRSGCETGSSLPAGVTTETIHVGDVDRQFLLAVPQGGGAGTALPLVLNLHGYGQPAQELEQYTQMADSGTRAGYAVVTPVGASNRWNFTRSAKVGPDDVLFVGALLNDLTGRMCLDPKRVFASGFSDGADMVLALACALPERFAAAVTVASSRLPDACAAPRASLLELHGTDDRIAPFNGGGQARTAPYDGLVAQPVEARTDRYARALGCGGEHSTAQDFTHVARTTWTTCPAGKDVAALAMQGGGHTWPGAAPRPELGGTVTNLSATVVALAFFSGHPADGRTVTGGGSGGGAPATGGAATGGATAPTQPPAGAPATTPPASAAPGDQPEPTPTGASDDPAPAPSAPPGPSASATPTGEAPAGAG